MREKYEAFFSTSHLGKGIGRQSVRGGMFTVGGQMINFCAQIGSTMILARLLMPEDFGLIAMVAVFTRFLLMFSDMGLCTALIQAPKLSHKEASGFFWLSLALCALLSGVLFVSSPLIASFYSEPRLVRIIQVIALTFIISGLGLQHLALLRRRMEFGRVAIVDYASSMLAMLAAVIAAWQGAGYWSLVVMSIARPLIQTGLAWWLCPWIPGGIEHPRIIKKQLGFAGFLAGHNFIQYFSRNADKGIIGYQVGADALGGYTKAYQFILLPVTQLMMPLRGVVMPALCRLRDDEPKLEKFYLRFVKLVAYGSVAMGVGAVLFSEEIVAIILGRKWEFAIPIFRVFSIGLCFSSLGFIGGWLMIAYGNGKKLLYFACVSSPLSILMYFIGSRWGVIGVASAVILSEAIFRGGMLFYASIVCELSIRGLLRSLIPAYTLGGAILMVSIGLIEYYDPEWVQKIAMVLISAVVFTGLALMMKPYREDLLDSYVCIKNNKNDE